MLQNRCLGTLSVGGLSLVYRSWLTLAVIPPATVIRSHTAGILSGLPGNLHKSFAHVDPGNQMAAGPGQFYRKVPQAQESLNYLSPALSTSSDVSARSATSRVMAPLPSTDAKSRTRRRRRPAMRGVPRDRRAISLAPSAVTSTFITLSHTDNHAMACVVLEGNTSS